MWVAHLLDALEEREQPAQAEQDERHDEAPEVALAAVSEGMFGRGLSAGPAAAEQQQALVARVGEGVGGLCQQTGRPGDEESHELGDGDAQVGQEGGDDGSLRSFVHDSLGWHAFEEPQKRGPDGELGGTRRARHRWWPGDRQGGLGAVRPRGRDRRRELPPRRRRGGGHGRRHRRRRRRGEGLPGQRRRPRAGEGDGRAGRRRLRVHRHRGQQRGDRVAGQQRRRDRSGGVAARRRHPRARSAPRVSPRPSVDAHATRAATS